MKAPQSKSNTGFELTLYFHPSPYGIDWSSPSALAASVIKNQLSRQGRAIGHVHIELKAPENYRGPYTKHVITGMTQYSNWEERQLLLFKQAGLSILFHSFKGQLEQTEDSLSELKKRAEKGIMSFLRMHINEQTHARALQYLNEYKDRRYFSNYGLFNRPLHGEGAGCSAFGASFLQVTGLMQDEFMKQWMRFVRVPEILMGGAKRKVSLMHLMKPNHRWAEEHEEHRGIEFWCPDRMHEWLVKTWETESKSPSGLFLIDKLENALGLITDLTHITPPSGPFWEHEK